MNKAQLIDTIVAKSGLTKADAKKATEALIDVISETLKSGDRIALVGFGAFGISERKQRTGRNPQTGKEITIAAKRAVKFKAGGDLTGQLQ